MQKSSLFIRHIALPQDHGSWVFLFSPLLIGLFAGGALRLATLFLVVGALAAFLVRQPVTMAVKIFSGRRARRDLPAAWFWTGVYALVGLAALVGLLALGYGYLLALAVPGLPVFAWHLALVARRQERKQALVEVVGSGVLALAAPAAYWVGRGAADPLGWLLFVLAWMQSGASIVYAYLRLEQRSWKAIPETGEKLRAGRWALAWSGLNLLAVLGLWLGGITPGWLGLPFAVQAAEALWGTLHPAAGYKPTAIGFRQLAVSSLFTLLFIIVWGQL
ncbi:MAG: YwiC-like family protein [Chloroflexota bacterium]